MDKRKFIEILKEVSTFNVQGNEITDLKLLPDQRKCHCGKQAQNQRINYTQAIINEKVVYLERCSSCQKYKNPFSNYFNLRGSEWSVAFSAYVLGQDNPYKSRDKKRELKAK